jgi:hypothetical protein
MKSQHPTDEFVRRKLAEQSPEFNEAHWEQAMAMLEEGAKPGAFAWLRRWWLLLPVLLLAMASLGWWLYEPGAEERSGNSPITLIETPLVEEVMQTPLGNKNDHISNTEKSTLGKQKLNIPEETIANISVSTTPNSSPEEAPVLDNDNDTADQNLNQAGSKGRVLAADGVVGEEKVEAYPIPVFDEKNKQNEIDTKLSARIQRELEVIINNNVSFG